MKIENFIISLEGYYECKYTQEIINRINKWMEGNGVQERHLDRCFDTLTANFKAFSYKKRPDLKDIIDAFGETSLDKENINHPYEKQRSEIIKMGVRDIVKMMKNLRAKLDKDGDLSPLDTDALHDWDEMRIECDAMKEHGMPGEEIRIHMENMKTALSTGAKFDSIFYKISSLNIPRPEVEKRGMHQIEEVV